MEEKSFKVESAVARHVSPLRLVRTKSLINMEKIVSRVMASLLRLWISLVALL